MAAHSTPPPLYEGQSLTSAEFLRRWEAMPGLTHAELLDGIVHMPSPVTRTHSRFHITLSAWLLNYETSTPGCEAGAEGTWLMGDRNDPQPDLTLRILPHCGGQSREEDDYTAGAPELIVEVATSTASRDLGIKFSLYERMEVREYLAILPNQSRLIWNELTPTGYRPLEPGPDAILRSRCFPGLWLDPAALWRRDHARIFAILQQGLATPDHAAFAARLAHPSL